MPWLDKRRLEPEVMDQPDLDPRKHAVALDALARINWLSWTASSLFKPLRTLQRRLNADQLRILDMACGGGDVAVRLSCMADALGLDWRISGCDFSPVAVDHARKRAFRTGAKVHFFQHNALGEPPPGPFDAALCTLFLHHLSEDDAISLLRSMAASAALVLVSDLRRSHMGLLLANVVGRLVTFSPVVHADGPQSVRAAFTISEVVGLTKSAGLEGASVRPIWPCRWLLSWERP